VCEKELELASQPRGIEKKTANREKELNALKGGEKSTMGPAEKKSENMQAG